MRRRLLTITAVTLFVAALAGWAWFLSRQSLQDADQWSSVAGLFVNTLLTTGSLTLAWLARRSPAAGPRPDPGADQVTDSGNARATAGGNAGTGVDGTGDSRPARVTRSGDATADGPGSVANTGVQRRRQP
ncbi:MAG TPA: hypothetical protein VN408_30985 [Actinoplanes sp.]|nr:hypothetical protein [Actinoplanes sp.]